MSTFSGTIYEPYDFISNSTHTLVVHADPVVEKSAALCSTVRTQQEMRRFSAQAFQVFRRVIPGDIQLFQLPTEGFLTMALGFTLDSAPSDWQEQALLEELRGFLMDVIRQVEEAMSIRLNIFVSELHGNTQNVYDAYQEVFSMAVHYPFLPEKDQVMLFRDFKTGLDSQTVIEKQLLEERMFPLMTAHRYREAQPLLVELIHCRASAPRTVTSLKQELIARMNYFAYQLLDISGLAQINRERLLTKIDHARAAKSMEELENWARDVLELFQLLWDSTQNGGSLSWADRISDYVRKNYSDPALNAALLGRVFDLNPAYISHIFHKGTGVKLVDYIHMTRIEHIKLLLAHTAMELGEIARLTGYYDGRAMSRVFTRYEGVTPTQYRSGMGC